MSFTRLQYCPGCKKSRSLTQFEGHETCRLCRGLTGPSPLAGRQKPVEKQQKRETRQLLNF